MKTEYSKAIKDSFKEAVYASWLNLKNDGGSCTIKAIMTDMQVSLREFEETYISLGFDAGFELFAARDMGKNLVIINNRRVSHLMFHNH